MDNYSYLPVVSRFNFYNVRIKKMSLYYDNENHALDYFATDSPNWGMPSPLLVKAPEKYPLPVSIELRWITALEGKCFEFSGAVDQFKAEELWKKQELEFPNDPYTQYIIGIAPYGGVAVWLCSNYRSVLLHWLKAEETQLTEEELMIHKPHPIMESLTNLLMPYQKLQSDIKQYNYRYVALEEYFDGEKWQKYSNEDDFYEELDVDGVEDKRLDGTFDYSDSVDMLRYHIAGKPQRITVRWQEENSNCFAHFWLDEDTITIFFNSMFDTFPDTKADLLLRCDTRANRYEVAMTGEGLPIRRLDYCQYIVFRNNVEIARSEYFSKEDGEWSWK